MYFCFYLKPMFLCTFVIIYLSYNIEGAWKRNVGTQA